MKGILVFLEGKDDVLKRSSYEAITAARGLAGSAPIVGFIVHGTDAQMQSAGAYGLTSCINATSDGLKPFANGNVAAAISEVATSTNSDVVLMAANATGKDIGPRVSVRLAGGLLADCIELHAEGDTVVATRPVYAGKATVKVKATTQTTIATLRPNVFTAKKVDAPSAVAVQNATPAVDASMRSSVVTGMVKNEGSVDVAEADIIVSGGRGLKGPEHFQLIENLAKALGAAVGASRAVVDAGWRPHREQVGQTGKTVSPSMYVACGISGAVQHLAGMSTSKYIVAINKDKDAPIFKMADYGLVGDVFEIIPKLTEKISAVTGRS